jgi:diguanylate cyclase (GGDEF)-like protein
MAVRTADERPRRVLVVEDEGPMRELLARHFRKLGHQVVLADSVEEVQRRGHLDREWDVVVTDVHLPGLSGIELARRLSDRADSLILVTGDHDRTLYDEAMRQVRAGYLLKPFELFELDAAIRLAETKPVRGLRTRLRSFWPKRSRSKAVGVQLSQETGVPVRALLLSLGALAVPVVATLMGAPSQPDQLMLWVSALIPPFLLAYYRGWRGAAGALALGMGALALTQAAANALSIEIPDGKALLGMLFAFILTCLGAGWLSSGLHAFRRKAESFALMDPLTGLANRGHLQTFLESRFAAGMRRREQKVGIVFFDLDHFKSWNDELGHDSGDTALVAFADVLRRNTRAMDLAARYGGEEFIVVLSEVNYSGAMVYVDRVRDSLKQLVINGRKLSVSIGVAFQDPSMQMATDLVAAADAAMLSAKEAGRDCVRVYAEGAPVKATLVHTALKISA